MSQWDPVAGVSVLRDQMNERFPNRDKRTDGIIGNAEHAARASDHNPLKRPAPSGRGTRRLVHALDLDKDFGNKENGPDKLVDQILAECRKGTAGFERIKYVVWNDQVASGTYQDTFWVLRGSGYSHFDHIHVSFTQIGEYDTLPFKLAIFKNALWDGHFPPLENITRARQLNIFHPAVYRVAARLHDLGFFKGTPKYGKQKYPTKAIQKFQKAMGGNGRGNLGPLTYKLLFGISHEGITWTPREDIP